MARIMTPFIKGKVVEYFKPTLLNLQYKSWHDVKIYDLLWLCQKHHDIVHQHIKPPKKGASTFLAIETMRLLATQAIDEVASSKRLVESDLMDARTQLDKQIQLQKNTKDIASQHSGIPIWLTGWLMTASLLLGVLLGVFVIEPALNRPSNAPTAIQG